MPDLDGEVYVGDEEFPRLILSAAVVRRFDGEGVWHLLNDRAGLMIDRFETEIVPVQRLPRFRGALASLVERYSASATETEVKAILTQLGGVANGALDASETMTIVLW